MALSIWLLHDRPCMTYPVHLLSPEYATDSAKESSFDYFEFSIEIPVHFLMQDDDKGFSEG